MSTDGLVDVSRRVLVEFLVVPENNDRDIYGAENGELVRLLEETAFALEKRPIARPSASCKYPETVSPEPPVCASNRKSERESAAPLAHLES